MQYETRTIPCYHCSTTVLAKVIGSTNNWDEDYLYGIKFDMITCPKCGKPSFGCINLFQPSGDDYFEEGQFVILYPSGNDVSSEVPQAIKTWLEEANKCFMVAAFTSSAIMCRKSLEAICAHEKAEGKFLQDKLKYLKDKGFIDGRLYEWADGLRLSGNEAAHEVENVVSSDDAKDLLDFTHAIVDYIYTFSLKYERFKSRKLTATNKTTN